MRGRRRLFRLSSGDRRSARREVDDEVRLHIELRTEELVRAGMDPREARVEADRLFATREETMRTLYIEAWRRSRRMSLRARLDLWRGDARSAVRGLARDPLLAGFIVVTMGLAMGATLASFSLVDRMLLRDPEHIRSPDELVRLFGTVQDETRGEVTTSWVPYGAYEQLRDGLDGVAGIGAYRIETKTVGVGLDAGKRRVGEALDGFFPALGGAPLMGRYLTPEETRGSAGPLAVVNEAYWRDVLGGDRSVIGRTVQVDGDPHTVVGVAPLEFAGTELRKVEVWVTADRRWIPNRGWQVVARLAPEASAEAVSAPATAINARTAAGLPSWFRWFEDATVWAGPITLDRDGSPPFEATMARWLAVMSALILAVALANVANLLLARLARRRRDLAVRVTLGSGRSGIIRLLGLEGLTLAAAAGALSLGVVAVAEPFLRDTLLTGDAPWTLSLLEPRLLGVLVLLVLLTSLCIAAVPAARAGSDRLTAALRSGAGHGGGRSSGLRAALTVLQGAFSVVLLVGAGLFLLSMARVRALDLGADVERVLVLDAGLPAEASSPSRGTELDTYEALARHARALPGVASAAVAIGMPLDGGSFSTAAYIPGRDSVPSLPGGGPYVSAVGTDYFATVGTAVLRGRPFTDGDARGAEPVLIVNETMARTLWPASEAVGRCVRMSEPEAPCARIVGVVADVHRVGLAEQPSMQVYLPARQERWFGGAALVVRPAERSPITPAALRRALLESVPSLPMLEVQRLDVALDDDLRPLRLGLASFGLSAGLALLVATLGLYSVMAYMVAWRTHEIGVRSALGATRSEIVRLIVRSSAGLAGAGIVIGLALAFALARWLEPYLFRTQAADPAVFGAVTATLVLVALGAGLGASRRAVRISPLEALRGE